MSRRQATRAQYAVISVNQRAHVANQGQPREVQALHEIQAHVSSGRNAMKLKAIALCSGCKGRR